MSRFTEIWRYALEEGRITCREVEARFGLKQCSGSAYLYKLHERGELTRFERDPAKSSSRIQYGVTKDCKIPRGVKIKEIIG